jgi:hypothetical protein
MWSAPLGCARDDLTTLYQYVNPKNFVPLVMPGSYGAGGGERYYAIALGIT